MNSIATQHGDGGKTRLIGGAQVSKSDLRVEAYGAIDELGAAMGYDLARSVCRRAERLVVRLREAGEEVDDEVIRYLNRLSDLLWLFGRTLELRAGVDSRLRDEARGGNQFSRAW